MPLTTTSPSLHIHIPIPERGKKAYTPLLPYSTEQHSTSQRKERKNEISDVHCVPSHVEKKEKEKQVKEEMKCEM
jgi:hypothetical protein